MQLREPILYIDDELLNLESFKLLFEDLYLVFTANSAKEAYRILANNEVKVVISDLRMPEVSGIELLEVVKQKYPDIVRILLTAFIQEEYLLQAINKGGVFRYLTKPWQFVELSSVIQTALETYNLKTENKKLIKQLNDKITLLSLSEEKFKNIYNSTSEGILIFDFDKNILNANMAIFDILGVTAKQLIGKSISKFIFDKQLDIFMKRFAQIKENEKLGTFDYKFFLNGSKKIYVQVKSDLIQYEGQPAIISVLHDITEQKNIEKQVYIAQVNAEEKERERLAKELHDGIGPLLSTLKIYMHDIQTADSRESQNTSLIKSGEIINEVISGTKEISNNISPHVLRNFGLIQAIKGFIEKLVIRPDIHFDLKSNLNTRIDEIIEITLYRITTELINNTFKYADAHNVYISITKKENAISFKYKDDGKGFDYNLIKKQGKGLGLQNIQSRVYAIGGELEYISNPGEGIDVTISLTILE